MERLNLSPINSLSNYSQILQSTVLDVGCGMGQFVKHCHGSKGVDINNDCVEFCKKNGLNVVKMENDLLPFEDTSFDTIVLDNVLEHIMDPLPLLHECRRVLTRHGRLIILVPGQKVLKEMPTIKNFMIISLYVS